MTETVSRIKKSLSEIYPPEEVNAMMQIILKEVCDVQIHQILCGDPIYVSPEKEAEIAEIIERLKKNEPLQYILGNTEFEGMVLDVNSSVLIPRPETAELVELIYNDYKNTNPTILDIGTGSGCIAISLAKKLKESKVYAIDISAEALSTAKKNAEKNNVEVCFLQGDALNATRTAQLFSETFDVIVSNPPYITEKEKQEMEKNVLDFEPEMALFVPNECPMLFYTPICAIALMKLKDSGTLYLEINSHLGQQTVEEVKKAGFGNVELIKDFYGKDRIIKASR